MSQENRRCNEGADPGDEDDGTRWLLSPRWAADRIALERDGRPACAECGETLHHFHYSPHSFDDELRWSIDNLERAARSRPLRRFTLPEFATGGSFVVDADKARESAPPDAPIESRLMAFRLTPGESIHVRTPQQVARARRSWWRRLFARIRRAFTRRSP